MVGSVGSCHFTRHVFDTFGSPVHEHVPVSGMQNVSVPPWARQWKFGGHSVSPAHGLAQYVPSDIGRHFAPGVRQSASATHPSHIVVPSGMHW